MKVFTAHVTTESCDHYIWVYAKNPTRKQIIKRLYEEEGKCEKLSWYDNTTRVVIGETEVIE